MRRTLALAALAALATPVFGGENTAPPPFKSGERLRYEVVWPSGLSLGEAEFTAQAKTGGWSFEANLTADLPTLAIRETYRATADAALCSLELEKEAQRGAKTIRERVTFDQAQLRAERETLDGGGSSEFDIPPCARDGLTYLYVLRQNLAAGRIPPPDDINFGAQYLVTVTYAETREIPVAGEMQPADRILVDLSGPGSSHSFEIFFGKDEARTPLLIRAPFELGVFSLKLVE